MIDFLLSYPWSIPFVDAGLALTKRNSGVRKKLLLMSAILEATPQYYSYFLSKNESPLYVFYITFILAKSFFKALVGIALLKIL
jgi:hypothetical protein